MDLLAEFRPGDDWSFTGDISFVAAQSVGEKSNAAVRLELSDYAVLNAKVQKSFPREGVDVYVRATNLTDTPYIYEVGFPAPAVTFYAGMELPFLKPEEDLRHRG